MKRKDGLYQASCRMGLDADGRPLRPIAYGKTAAEAQARLSRKVAGIKRGEYKRPDPMTVGKFLADLLVARRASNDLRESTFALYQGIVRKHIAPWIGDKRLDKLTARDIDALYSRLRSGGASERMVKFVHVILGMALAHAFKTEAIVKNPMLRVSAVPKYKAPEQATLTPEQGEHFLSVSRDDPLHALYVLALDTAHVKGNSSRCAGRTLT
ncbi:MAG TPA: N-terminal phage integrase SAM-like domain-containing protein [Candidatus Baltobacteraceae bacterium]|nr:N-terminal phage integrase SAM-like domain-containing protein [Candidatus Baltobacteraceae bacterium]